MSVTPSVEQWRRSYRLDFGSKRIESIKGQVALSIAFEVTRKSNPWPNAAKFRIYNLNEQSRAELQALSAVSVRCEVGYDDFLQQIFFGALPRIDSLKTQTEWITELSGGDAQQALSESRIYRSFPKGTPLLNVLSALVDALKLGKGNFDQVGGILGAAKLTHGLTLAGTVAEEMTQFTRSNGLIWSIQDGNFTLQEVDQPIPGTEGPKITPETGLIGSPKIDSKGVLTGTALILPGLLPGVPFRIESSRIKADCLCTATRHYGESRGTPWYVEFKGKGIGKNKLK